jgi:hypothetical protein
VHNVKNDDMTYNLYFGTQMGAFNIMGLAEEKLSIPIEAYLKGKNDFTISGQKYHINRLNAFQIFTHESKDDPQLIYDNAQKIGIAKRNLIGYYIPPEGLEKLGKNVTDEKIGDAEFGQEAAAELAVEEKKEYFINPDRIKELSEIKPEQFDFSRLLQLCHEINDNYSRNNYLSVAMIGRSILNHVPPLFGFDTFNQVANNYGNKSFKGVMNHLNNTMRSIADSYLHDTMRKKENIPNSNQVNFSQDLDVLLSEIVRIN